MFAEFLTKKEFYERYMQLFSLRFTVGNLEMEDEKIDVSDSRRAIEMYNNMNAFMTLIEKNVDKITPYDVIDIADNVNKNINYFDKGFRKTQVNVKCAKNFFPIEAKNITYKMYSLFDTYNNIWYDLPIYEKEARLHIELVRMQPFEDGNKRTARILTNYNLCKQNKAPIVITGKETDEYFKYIDTYDIYGMKGLFERKSKEELNVMLELYETICGDDLFDDEGIQTGDNINLSYILKSIKKENLLSANSNKNNISIAKKILKK